MIMKFNENNCPMIELETTTRYTFDTGFESTRKIISYRPVLNLDRFPCASGKISFPVFEEWEDASPEDHIKARIHAITEAFKVLNLIFENADSIIKDA